MNKTLYVLCRHSVSILDGWIPCPARIIADETGVSVSTARRRLRDLKLEGYAASTSVRLDEVDGYDRSIPYNGWCVTANGRKTEEYQKALIEERALCLESFGVDIAPQLGDI